ncbi:MAG: hypothetical protein AB4426_01845 [Xenococcaceae cyanobacterium]
MLDGKMFLISLFRFFHFLGLSILFAGLFLQAQETQKPINKYIWAGSLVQLITGLTLTTLKSSELDPRKITAKFILLLFILIISWAARKKSSDKTILILLFALTILEMIIAVFWKSILL